MMKVIKPMMHNNEVDDDNYDDNDSDDDNDIDDDDVDDNDDDEVVSHTFGERVQGHHEDDKEHLPCTSSCENMKR